MTRTTGLAAWVLVPAIAFTAGGASPAEVEVQVVRSGDALEVEASAEFTGTVARTWEVLTAYDHYSEFIPDMHVSRVLSRTGNRVEVQQNGQVRFLFVGFPIDVRLSVVEHPYERIVSRATGGNFREMQGMYRLAADKGRVRLTYSGRLVPEFSVPPVLGPWIFRHSIENTFRALVDEIERQPARVVPPRNP